MYCRRLFNILTPKKDGQSVIECTFQRAAWIANRCLIIFALHFVTSDKMCLARKVRDVQKSQRCLIVSKRGLRSLPNWISAIGPTRSRCRLAPISTRICIFFIRTVPRLASVITSNETKKTSVNNKEQYASIKCANCFTPTRTASRRVKFSLIDEGKNLIILKLYDVHSKMSADKSNWTSDFRSAVTVLIKKSFCLDSDKIINSVQEWLRRELCDLVVGVFRRGIFFMTAYEMGLSCCQFLSLPEAVRQRTTTT